MSTTALRCLAVSALTLAGLTLPGPAVADDTCQGRSATVVGTPGEPLEGTTGNDVIVSNGATTVSALEGNDTICVTGPTTGVTVDAGPGNDLLVPGSLGSTGPVNARGGDGTDTVVISLPGGTARTWALDAKGTLKTGSSTYLLLGGLETYDVLPDGAAKNTLTFTGSARAETLIAEDYLKSASMGGGNDALRLTPAQGNDRIKVDGGGGQDLLAVLNLGAYVELDFNGGVFRGGDGGGTHRGFEDGEAQAEVVQITGNAGGNRLTAKNCERASIYANEGNDTILVGKPVGGVSCDTVAFGEEGNDVIKTSNADDVINGGDGRDKANAKGGRDVCRDVESAHHCEQRSRVAG